MLHIHLPDDIERQLAERAKATGRDVESCVREAVEAMLNRGKTLPELLAPAQKAFEESGMSDQEFLSIVESAREEAWQARQTRAKAS